MEDPSREHETERARATMVEWLRAMGHGNPTVWEVMGRVPRHRFVSLVWVRPPGTTVGAVTVHQEGEPGFVELAYEPTRGLFTRMVDGQPTSAASAPTVVADMLALADLARGMRVLEIGAGTGYNAALIAELVGDAGLVTTVDIDADLVASARHRLAALRYSDIEVIHGDGFVGHAARGPYDRIIATVGCPDLAPAWFDQLAPGGLMLIPLEHASWHPLMAVRVTGDGGEARTVGCSGFVPIQGAMDRPGPWPARLPEPPEPDLDPVPAPAWAPEVFGDAPEGGGYPPPLLHFAYYLALADRSSRYWGLDDGDGCYAAIEHDKAQIIRRGEHGPDLATRLIDHLEAWNLAGRPHLVRYRHRFRPPGSSPEECTWAVERAYFRQETTLTDPA